MDFKANWRAADVPAWLNFLFTDPRMAWLWLPVRVGLGAWWINKAMFKLGNPAWTSGQIINGFWTNAVTVGENGRSMVAFPWYQSFLEGLIASNSGPLFANLVMIGELAVGVLLIAGAFTGVAVTLGMLLNWNYLMAGSAGDNPMFLLLGVLILCAWRIAGLVGADLFIGAWLRGLRPGGAASAGAGASKPQQA